MPYIKPEQRVPLDRIIEELCHSILNTDKHTDAEVMLSLGKLNYTITRICGILIGSDLSYKKIAMITGVLENVKQEFYRRVANAYEDGKIVQNGDVPEYLRLEPWKAI